MAFIHKEKINYILRKSLFPFRSLIPKRYHFAINGKETVRLTEGKDMVFIANPTSNLHRVLFWYGIQGFEFNEYSVFVFLAKKSRFFCDIGANIGYYSILAKKFNPKINVYGFEPLPSANKYFHLNTKLNEFSDIVISSIALSNEKGKATFYSNINPRFTDIEDHLFGDNSLNSEACGNISRIEIEVETDTLDHFVHDNFSDGIKIDLMKIDTEATEHFVLEGSHNVLKNHRPIIMCEVIKGFTENVIEAVFLKYDYIFYKATPMGLISVSSLSVENSKQDFFFVPKEKISLITEITI